MFRKSACAGGALALAVLLTGCGGTQPPPQTPEIEDGPVESSSNDSDMAVSSEIGGLNQDQVQRAFEKGLDGAKSCMMKRAERNELLGGEIAFSLLIDRTGNIVEHSITSSTIGDREAERCILGVLAKQRWPKPVGGEKGKADSSYNFGQLKDVRPPIEWSSEELEEPLAKLSDKIGACKDGAAGPFGVTMYVGTDGSPLSVGMAFSGDSDAAADCLVGVLMDAKYPSPGSWAAKVQFEL